jgi:hypothetical protein
MGEAKRKRQRREQSAWPRADDFRDTINLHMLPPAATINGGWRRGRDSNPRSPVRGTTVFETAPFDRSGTSPSERGQRLNIAPLERQENNPVIGTGAL